MATTLGTKAKDTFGVLSLLGLLAVGAPISTVKATIFLISQVFRLHYRQVSIAFWRSVLKMPPKKCRQRQMSRKRCWNSTRRKHLYGKRAPDLQSNASALIRKYEQAARENMKEATAHRQMEQPKPIYVIHDGQMPQTGNN